jgi:hypothetical protein
LRFIALLTRFNSAEATPDRQEGYTEYTNAATRGEQVAAPFETDQTCGTL